MRWPLCVGLILLWSCTGAPRPLEASAAAPATVAPRPSLCAQVSTVLELREAIASASAGSAVCLAPGDYPGGFTLDGITVWGPRSAVIRSSGSGTTVKLEGTARLLGVTVDGSGGRFDTLDAAVHLAGEGGGVEGVRVVNATFGILAERATHARISGNEVIGRREVALGMRGDGIRLWETHDSVVEHNRVVDSRDLVVWYSRRNTLRNNRVVGGRYGTHFMYSHDCVAEDSVYLGNEVGVFVMYSRGIRLTRNVIANGIGAAGMGLGLKESGDLVAVQNAFLHNTLGLYLDSSPIQQTERNRFEGNTFTLHDGAVVFHGTERNNDFVGNTFRNNQEQVRVEGGTHGLETTWEGNHFDDYQGFDLDGDGVGDLPYELESLAGQLVASHAELAFFRGSPALSLVSVAGEVLPVFAPKVLIRDPRPRVAPLEGLVVTEEMIRAD